MQISQPLEHSEHDLLDRFQTVVPWGVDSILEGTVSHVGGWHNSQVADCEWLIICHDEKILFLDLLPLWIVSGLHSEILILHLDDVGAQSLLLDLIKSGQLSLLISAVIKQLLDGNIILRILVRVQAIGLDELYDVLLVYLLGIDGLDD